MDQPQLGTYQLIALGDIQPSATNPRKTFDPAALAELADSIREMGVIEPITVRHSGAPLFEGGGYPPYTIVTGERRWRASQLAGLASVPAIVADLDDDAAAQVQMVENLQRADLHPMEEAEGYASLFLRGLTVEDVAKKTGKSATHVGRMLRLQHLSIAGRRLFLAAHITLGHALLLARLTMEDQERAVRELLRAQADYAKMPTMEVIEAREKNLAANEYVKHRRMVEMTEGQLRDWIAANVLLQLAKAPWSLEDPLLVPEAGPCTTCPKRTGSNPALFADLTADADVCMDAVCFGTKQRAFVQVTTKAAKQAGGTVLKLSAKSGHQPLGSWTPAKTKVQNGQWVAAEPGSCKAVTQGVLVDEAPRYSDVKAKPGELLTVCADQACKVHKHHVDRPSPKGGGSIQASAETPEKAAQRKAKAEALLEREKLVRGEIADEMLETINVAAVLRLATIRMMENLDGITYAAETLELKVPAGYADWQRTQKVEAMLTKHIKVAPLSEIARIALLLLLGEGLEIKDWNDPPDSDDSRRNLWKLAEFVGVDADAIAREVEARSVKAVEPEPPPPPAKPAKVKLTKAAAKKFSAKNTLSPDARQRIEAAKRFADARARVKTKVADRKTVAAGDAATDA